MKFTNHSKIAHPQNGGDGASRSFPAKLFCFDFSISAGRILPFLRRSFGKSGFLSLIQTIWPLLQAEIPLPFSPVPRPGPGGFRAFSF